MAHTTHTVPFIADFKYPYLLLHSCTYCKRIIIDSSAPDTVHLRNHATFVNPFKFEYAEIVQASNDGCTFLLPVLDAIQSQSQSLDTSSPHSGLLAAGTLFIDIHIKYQEAKGTVSEFTNVSQAKVYWRQANRNVSPEQGNPVVRFGDYIISAELDDRAATYISQRPQYPWINTVSTFTAIKEWLHICNTRSKCLQVPDLKDSTRLSRGPSRMILVGRSDLQTVRIVSPKNRVKYIALSYCWGGDSSMRLTRADLDTWQQAIVISQLPKTLQDAIISTRLLGFEYLWVDRLCIVQDDPEDIHQEIAAMPEVYRNATLTLSASSAQSSDEGFLHTSPATYQRLDQSLVMLPYRCPDMSYDRAILTRLTDQDNPLDAKSPVDRRAWTMQEQMLSTRLIQFGSNGIHWICKCSSVRHWHDGIEVRTEAKEQGKFYQPRDMDFDWAWAYIVVNYTQRALSVQTDKLIALAAVAQDISIRVDKPTRYLAGIWQHQLPNNLMWCVDGKNKGLRPSSYRAPSWSWAAVDGQINPDYFGWDTSYAIYLTIRDCAVTPVSPMLPYGSVAAGYISVRGRLRKMKLNLETKYLQSSMENDGKLARSILDAADETIPRDPTGGWLLVFCLEVGCKFSDAEDDEEPQPCAFGLILTPASDHASSGYFDEEAETPFPRESVFRRVGIFDSENLGTAKTISFGDCPVMHIKII
ncbi:heterokaryon incompatibility protein-domain-containing protein [Rhexocercosporidium sp. MPI-PUGE-AT-0058]|nr:heterokaryon incompatibility protein-domain-containing protein [Rhexocercosporidium sp. MPI-PUGE-AT-0058]